MATVDSTGSLMRIVSRSHSRGFTLLEIMISLAIFSVVASALVRNTSLAVRQTAIVNERTLAWWVAENHLNELRASPRVAGNYPAIGTQRSSVTMSDREWELVSTVRATENEDMRRIVVTVYKADDSTVPVVALDGFFGKH